MQAQAPSGAATDPASGAAPGRSDGRRGSDGVSIQLVRLRRSMEALRAQVLEAGGHGIEGSALAALYHLTSSGPMRTSALADRLGLDPSTTSRHAASLEREGYLERVADPDDGRAWLVQATTSGRQAFGAARTLRDELVAAALQQWAPHEVDAFAAALARFNDSVLAIDLREARPCSGAGREDRR